MTGFVRHLARELARPSPAFDAPLVADLFAGCGGLALGFEAAGFRTIGYELRDDPVRTYSQNLAGECVQVMLQPDTPIADADVIIGGPPCQPFSVGGYQRGRSDTRDGFPAFLSAVERVRPRLALFENVRGMLYRNKSYLARITARLKDLGYIVDYRVLNAVNYGVPQRRERLVCVAYQGVSFAFPQNTCKFAAGAALGELALQCPPSAKILTKSQDAYVAKYERKSACVRPRDLNLAAPSRTVTCRNLAGATGDMMRIRLPDGRRRRLSVRESSRLQSFPDWYEFHGAEASQFEQIGNAVPPLFAKALAHSVWLALHGEPALEDHAIDGTGQLILIR